MHHLLLLSLQQTGSWRALPHGGVQGSGQRGCCYRWRVCCMKDHLLLLLRLPRGQLKRAKEFAGQWAVGRRVIAPRSPACGPGCLMRWPKGERYAGPAAAGSAGWAEACALDRGWTQARLGLRRAGVGAQHAAVAGCQGCGQQVCVLPAAAAAAAVVTAAGTRASTPGVA